MKLTAGRITAIGGLTAAASLAFLVAGADAHHPEVSTSAVCSNGQAQVRINTASWETDTPEHRYNSNVQLSWDGTTIGGGAFLPSNNYAFSITYTTTADGSTHTVRATAVPAWGPNAEYGFPGEFRETTVTLPTNCVAPTTTAAPTTTVGSTTVTTPTTTVAGTTPTSTVPVIVGGETETRPDVAPPIALQPRFAG